jgi:hypothetical protein
MSRIIFGYGTITPFGISFQKFLLTMRFVTHPFLKEASLPYNPSHIVLLLHNRFGLLRVRSPLLAEYLF